MWRVPPAIRVRRPQWRGERHPILTRIPAPVAAELADMARELGLSVSETVASLVADGLARRSKELE